MKIKITDCRLTESMMTPAHVGDAGLDLYACIDKSYKLFPEEVVEISSGIKVAIPEGWVGLILPKSGKGSNGMHLANATGVIDSGYRGEVIMKIKNNSEQKQVMMLVNPMEAVSQMVIVPRYNYDQIEFTNDLDETNRGEDGFGSTRK